MTYRSSSSSSRRTRDSRNAARLPVLRVPEGQPGQSSTDGLCQCSNPRTARPSGIRNAIREISELLAGAEDAPNRSRRNAMVCQRHPNEDDFLRCAMGFLQYLQDHPNRTNRGVVPILESLDLPTLHMDRHPISPGPPVALLLLFALAYVASCPPQTQTPAPQGVVLLPAPANSNKRALHGRSTPSRYKAWSTVCRSVVSEEWREWISRRGLRSVGARVAHVIISSDVER
ncbi:hypothetical protein ACEPAI_3346 [Sanghuangporus weigelae]